MFFLFQCGICPWKWMIHGGFLNVDVLFVVHSLKLEGFMANFRLKASTLHEQISHCWMESPSSNFISVRETTARCFLNGPGRGGYGKRTPQGLGITTFLKGTFPIQKETSLPRSIFQVLCYLWGQRLTPIKDGGLISNDASENPPVFGPCRIPQNTE